MQRVANLHARACRGGDTGRPWQWPRPDPLREIVLRTFIAAAAALLAVGATSPALAVPLAPPMSAGSSVVRALPGASAAGLTVRKKKKETVTLQKVENATLGSSKLKITFKVAKPERTCQLEIKWKDGSSTNVDDVEADEDKICEFKEIEVPKSSKNRGDASVTVKVLDGTGKKVASLDTTFAVK